MESIGRVLLFSTTSLVIALWIAIWSTATLFFDRCLVVSVARQIQALKYANVEGVVTSSRVVGESDGEGTSYKPEIRYRYAVGGRELTGDRVSYGPGASAGFLEADRLVHRFEQGRRVPVYYDTADAADSLLVPGLTTGQAFMALFLVPFNVIMLVGCVGAAEWIRSFTPGYLPRGVKLHQTYDGFTLRLWSTSPLAIAALTLGSTSFAGTFVAGLGGLVLPSELLLLAVWTAVIGLTVGMHRRQWWRATVLEVNELRGTFEISDAAGRRPNIGGSLQELQTVSVRERIKTDSDGERSRTYSVALVVSREKQRLGRRCLVAGWTEPPVRRLVKWLAERLKLPVKGPLA